MPSSPSLDRRREDQHGAGQPTISRAPSAEDAYGTVDDCIGYVQRLFDAGADEILFLVQMGTVPQTR